jgi:hypothetical protein
MLVALVDTLMGIVNMDSLIFLLLAGWQPWLVPSRIWFTLVIDLFCHHHCILEMTQTSKVAHAPGYVPAPTIVPRHKDSPLPSLDRPVRIAVEFSTSIGKRQRNPTGLDCQPATG